MKGYYIGGIPCLDERDEIYHHGIKGQKWYIRRFQNEDGSLTPAGRERYYGNRGNLQRDLNRLSKERYRSSSVNLKQNMKRHVVEDQIRNLVRKNTGHDIANDSDAVKDSYIDSVKEKDRATIESLRKLVRDYTSNAKTADKRTQEIDKEISRLISNALSQNFDVIANPKGPQAAPIGLEDLHQITYGFLFGPLGSIGSTGMTYLTYGDIPYIELLKYKVSNADDTKRKAKYSVNKPNFFNDYGVELARKQQKKYVTR